jgi:hypothetical protein
VPRVQFSIVQIVALMVCIAILAPWWVGWFETNPTPRVPITVQLPVLATTTVNTVVSVPNGGSVLLAGSVHQRDSNGNWFRVPKTQAPPPPKPNNYSLLNKDYPLASGLIGGLIFGIVIGFSIAKRN